MLRLFLGPTLSEISIFSRAYFLGKPGELGFGVAAAPESVYTAAGFIPLEGHNTIGRDNYGNYLHVASGAICVYIPKHYYKIAGNTFTYSDTAADGYVLDRTFINAGAEIRGIFVSKYGGTNNGGIFSSQQGKDPLSTNSAHNPISALNGTPLNTYGGLYTAVKTMSIDAIVTPIWTYNMLARMAKAHGEASLTTDVCAYIDVVPKMPKGNLANALKDYNDTSVTFTASGYSNCALTGSGSNFAKTTHNGQKCGIADLTGNMFEVGSGLIRFDSTGFLVIKESVDITTILNDSIITGGGGAYDRDLYDVIDISDLINTNSGWTYIGNGTSNVFGFSTDRNSAAYKRTSVGIPLANGVSGSGTAEFGNDGLYKYLINELAAFCGGHWFHSSAAGPFAMNLNNNRTNSNNNVGARDSGTKPETAMADTGARGVCCPAISEIKRDDRVSSSYAERHQVSRAPKREGRLFELTFTMDNLYEAYITARKGKRKKRATMRFESNLGAELQALYDELHDGTYMPRPYAQFEVYEPKKRVINAPAFRDLVVQHCIYAAIYDLFDRSFIATSYACRKGGGTHKASAYTQKAMRHYDGEDYYVKLDVKKFFYSIDRSILRALFEKKIKDKRFVDLMCAFAEMNDPKGIPIGNLLSQLYALIYMNPVDHYIKRDLKMKHYVRYVDDMVIIGVEKSKAKEIIGKVESFLKQYLRLEYSRWMMAKIKRGINFVGYRTWKSVKFVRKHSMYTFKMSLKKSKLESIVSLIGHAKKTATMTYYARLLLAEPEILNKLPQRSIACLNTTPTKK